MRNSFPGVATRYSTPSRMRKSNLPLQKYSSSDESSDSEPGWDDPDGKPLFFSSVLRFLEDFSLDLDLPLLGDPLACLLYRFSYALWVFTTKLEQPPSGWTCVRPEGTQPLPATIAAVRMDE